MKASVQTSNPRPNPFCEMQAEVQDQAFSSFRPHPSSCLSVSAQKLLNVWILGPAQAFISAAENNLTVAHHDHFAVDEAELLAFFFKDDLTRFVDDRVFRAEIIQIVHFVRDEDR